MKAQEMHRTRTLWLTGVLHAFTHLYQVALLPLYLRIQEDLKLRSVEQATLLVTVFGGLEALLIRTQLAVPNNRSLFVSFSVNSNGGLRSHQRNRFP